MADDRQGIFAAEDPFALLRNWLEEAGRSEPNDPVAMALATVDATGLPNVRTVLLKGIADGGLTFYTNYQSRKAGELDNSGKAAVLFHWKSLRRQVRARGTVSRQDPAASDAYFASRDLGSRLGAWASQQSRPLQDRATLEARVAEMAARFGENPPRPPHWGGYVLRPDCLEFWADGANRLHDRFEWVRDGDSWRVTRLNP
ncbi:pyridoxamine 5'-phosphate oxidase [Rhodobacteraceae bacterium 2CG4]|uniref:Pyridoxine/pyridoxamine 5'-phosphate oxidase n=1 Tax=Halovulum marinum TaxID=2662447 RepID=A0A6L5Z4C6_9RHOB|nr:pyridoxamine 5'-phosphate oxidase [Halovulum marinum]MSU90945.1 pyridoxamine 5'-phosphate oxidase [Halovulum marinum]